MLPVLPTIELVIAWVPPTELVTLEPSFEMIELVLPEESLDRLELVVLEEWLEPTEFVMVVEVVTELSLPRMTLWAATLVHSPKAAIVRRYLMSGAPMLWPSMLLSIDRARQVSFTMSSFPPPGHREKNHAVL